MDNKDDTIVLKLEGKFAHQLRQLKNKLGVESEMDVIRKSLSLLYFAIGSEVKIERKNRNQTLVFDQFKDIEPPENK